FRGADRRRDHYRNDFHVSWNWPTFLGIRYKQGLSNLNGTYNAFVIFDIGREFNRRHLIRNRGSANPFGLRRSNYGINYYYCTAKEAGKKLVSLSDCKKEIFTQ